MKVTIECETAFEARRALGGVDAWLALVSLKEEMHRIYRGKMDVDSWLRYWESTDLNRVELDGVDPDTIREVTLAWAKRLSDICDECMVDLDDTELAG